MSTFFGSYPFQKFRDLLGTPSVEKLTGENILSSLSLKADTVLYYLPTRTSLMSWTICVRSVQYLELETIFLVPLLSKISTIGTSKIETLNCKLYIKKEACFNNNQSKVSFYVSLHTPITSKIVRDVYRKCIVFRFKCLGIKLLIFKTSHSKTVNSIIIIHLLCTDLQICLSDWGHMRK